MTKMIQDRVAELSATLRPIDSYNIELTSEMHGEAEEFISYNTPYYYNGYQQVDFEGTYKGSILEKVGEFQVVRIFAATIFLDGEPYLDWFIGNHDDDYWDAEFDVPYSELKELKEVKQIWIGHDRQTFTVNIDTNDFGRDESYMVNVVSTQDWVTEHWCASIILNEVNELQNHCHDYCEPVLGWLLSAAREYVFREEPMFAEMVERYNRQKTILNCFRSIVIAHRHHFAFPTDGEGAALYCRYLDLLYKYNLDLHNPAIICPENIQKAYDTIFAQVDALEAERIARLRAEEAERERKRREREERDFNDNHSYLFNIEFTDDFFHYKSLDSIEAYKVEGDIMHHCIYNHGYYKEHHYLSMHIQDLEGNRVATCSINMQTRNIVCIQPIANDTGFLKTYGIIWQTTNDYKRIWNTLMARMHTFPQYKPEPEISILKVA